VDTESAGCCGASGSHILCHPRKEDGACDEQEDATTIFGRFIAVGQSMNYPDAVAYCQQHYVGIASIHSPAELSHAEAACYQFADPGGDGVTVAPGCWIGLSDEVQQGGFGWNDASAVDFVDWGPGEPNGWNGITLEDQVMLIDHFYDVDGTAEGAATCMASEEAVAGGACKYGPAGLFPLCQVQAAGPSAQGAQMVWGTGQTTSFRVEVCLDHVAQLFFQDDRLWLAHGGQWNPPGHHGSCPERMRGRAYVNNQEWDISALGDCEQGVSCPVSKTFTDEMFMVPQGCATIAMDAILNAGRGHIQSFQPTRASSFRGEIEIDDSGFGAADVYDITVRARRGG
jgi:hypothetical protein